MPETVTQRIRFAPQRTTLAVAVIAFLGALPLALSSPALTPLLLLPMAAFGWVLRARVVAAPIGLEVCNGLAVHRFRWQDVDRFDIPRRGPVVLHTTGSRKIALTALSRRDLRQVIEAGRPA